MKLDSLKNKAEFDFVYKNAKKFFHKYFILYALNIAYYKPTHFKDKRILDIIQSRQAVLYLGLSISRKIGKANKRNLLKRRLKAIVYENASNCEGLVFIFVAKEGITSLDFTLLKKDVLYAVGKIRQMFIKSSHISSYSKKDI